MSINPNDWDFMGWATRNNRLCSDGRTILKDAFIGNDGMTVPLMWGHQHDNPERVLGHALLENRDEGVFMYGKFNDTPGGVTAKSAVNNGDITRLSIYANQLKQDRSFVTHGNIREVSLVLAGANPGAFITSVIKHSAENEDEAVILTEEEIEVITHSDEPVEQEVIEHAEKKPEEKGDATIGDFLDSLDEKTRETVVGLMGMAYEDGKKDAENPKESEESKEGDGSMKHNMFDATAARTEEDTLLHNGLAAIIRDGKRCGTLKESYLTHAEDYGISNIEYLFPEPTDLDKTPQMIKNLPDEWVDVVMNGVHKSKFKRIRSRFADITEDEARAKGYIKGKYKKEEVFSLLKRSTNPTTVYKKQKFDKDDIEDIEDFDVVAWVKTEMRMMLNEEIARAILIGDGRLASDDDHIDDHCIRPIVNEADLFVIRYDVAVGATEDTRAKAMIRGAVKSRKNYRGSGRPIMITTEDDLTNMLLLEDNMGKRLYDNESSLATAMRVSRIVTMPYLENFKDKDNKDVLAIIVNFADYTVGADKGGAIDMFDDFDIDYNQMKYLMETRCSGAMTRPFSAIVLRVDTTGTSHDASPSMKDAMDEFRQ